MKFVEWGIEVYWGLGKIGFVGVICNGEGKSIGLCVDMDVLLFVEVN